MGTMNMDEVICALKAINYKGYFTFESGSTLRSAQYWFGNRKEFEGDKRLLNPPVELQKELERFMYNVGVYILKSYDEYDKIVIYYYNMLIKRYESLKLIENQLEHFFYVCNQYLSGKEFVYKPKSFEYAITVQSRNGTLKEMNIEQLSSGEKQIVALLSYIYLFVKQPCTIIIDEPELSLSVPWQETILEDIVKSQRCNQLIVATQSPFVYDNSLSCYAHSMEEFLGVE